MSQAIEKNSDLIAIKWAKALLDLVNENSGTSGEGVLSNLQYISETISSSEELSNVISNPSISTSEKQVVLCKLFQNNVYPIVYNFIFALNLKKRISIISQIAAQFKKELEKQNNVSHVGVTSAIELSEERKNDIKDKIGNKLQKEVVIDWLVDNSIIAGLIMNVDDTVVDNSIKHKLEDLSKQIIK